MHFDIFNGDADGICALIQLRLDRPLEAELVTGIKRDIQLLDKVSVNSGDSLTVLDISLEKNSRKVNEFLNAGASFFYVDHHQAGDIPKHPNFKALIDTGNAVCTSLLVNEYLGNKYPLWAVTAAYGDNLTNSAENLASTLQVSESELSLLHKLGVYINYNGYGNSIEDLHFYPDDLYKELVPYISPIDFIKANPRVYEKLELGYRDDMAKAEQVKPEFENEKVAVVLLPDQSWARRVSGVYGNALANQDSQKAHAVLSENNAGGYLVSVRAPLSLNDGAGEFCSRFSSGGGRKSAAGINHLPKQQFDFFVREFDAFFSKRLN
jgi:hypothetical protein